MAKNLINYKTGELTIIESLGYHLYNKKNGKRQEKFKCLCSCGEICEYWRGQIVSGQVSLCKNLQNHLLQKPKEDLSGLTFGKLKVIKFDKYDRSKYPAKQYWLCLCECGKTKSIVKNSLKNGDTKSCGCLEIKNRKKINENFKLKKSLPKYEAAFNALHYKYKICAKKRNIEFNLSREESQKLFSGNCYYCGTKPKKSAESLKRLVNGNPLVNGIDRVDNNQGYNLKNCVSCCKICNYAKRNLSKEEFETWIQELIFYQLKGLKND